MVHPRYETGQISTRSFLATPRPSYNNLVFNRYFLIPHANFCVFHENQQRQGTNTNVGKPNVIVVSTMWVRPSYVIVKWFFLAKSK